LIKNWFCKLTIRQTICTVRQTICTVRHPICTIRQLIIAGLTYIFYIININLPDFY